MGELGREVARAERLERGGGLAGVEQDLGEGRRRRAVARVLLQNGFAQRAGARGLAVAEEHPRGEEEELAVVAFHYLRGGGSWNTVTEIFSKARPSMAFLTRPLMEGM